jgi:hypothetical protein
MQLTTEQIHALWQRYHNPSANAAERQAHWAADVQLINQLGVSVDELMGFLFFQPRTVQEFENWLHSRAVKVDAELLHTPVLNEADLLFWQQHGYVVLHHAVPDEDCDAAAAAVWQYLEADPQNPESWYAVHEGRRGMMLQLFNHPALQRNRMSARIRKAYEQLYGHSTIQVTIDKVSFNAPETDLHKFAGTPLHWDVSLVPPVPYNLQGLLYLHDVDAAQGAFQCVPGFQLKINEWLRNLPPGTDARKLAAETGEPVTIAGKKGDMIIWHNALPHCASPNRGRLPRLVQYITWYEQRRVLSKEWK